MLILATVFSIGTDRDSAVDYINYCWAEVEGYSKFGSFTGNNSSDGPFIYMPFSPSYFIGLSVALFFMTTLQAALIWR